MALPYRVLPAARPVPAHSPLVSNLLLARILYQRLSLNFELSGDGIAIPVIVECVADGLTVSVLDGASTKRAAEECPSGATPFTVGDGIAVPITVECILNGAVVSVLSSGKTVPTSTTCPSGAQEVTVGKCTRVS